MEDIGWDYFEQPTEEKPEARQELVLLGRSIAELRKEIAAAEEVIESYNSQLKPREQKLMELMRETGMSTYQLDGVGKFTIDIKSSVKNPDTPEKKALFREYLMSKGLYDNMVSVHSRTLNSWYNKEREASDEGYFFVPGIDMPTEYTTLKFKGEK